MIAFFLLSAAFAIESGPVRGCTAEARLAPFVGGTADVLGRLHEEDWRAIADEPLTLHAAVGYEYALGTSRPAELSSAEISTAYGMMDFRPSASRLARVRAWGYRISVAINRISRKLGLRAPPAYVGGGMAHFVFEGGSMIASPLDAFDPPGPSIRFGVGAVLPGFFDNMRRHFPEGVVAKMRVAVVTSFDPERPREPTARDARVFEALVAEVTRTWPDVAFDVTLLVPAVGREGDLPVHVFRTHRPAIEGDLGNKL